MEQEEIEELKVGDSVVVLDAWDRPEYVGTVLGLSRRSVLVQRQGFFAKEYLVKRHLVEKLSGHPDLLAN